MRKAIGLLTCLLSLKSYGLEIPCKTKPWKGDTNASIQSFSMELEKVSRAEIIQMAWGESLKTDAKKSVALPLLRYLAGTEEKSTLRGYYNVLGISLTEQLGLEDAIAKWPERPKARKLPFTLKQLCQMYQVADTRK